ncbi:P-II family nitrogen regulator [Falsiroseomonas sp.]|uniref:P-II family nitrogen regulator n=1 Tax=Falsiroseomonas sp. TaxID=2870721 RepID=UPI003F708C97
MHERKRIEIVVERVRAAEVTDLLDRLGATGWTMLPVLAGRGRQGLRQGGDLSGVLDNVVILCITGEAVVARVMEAREELLGARPAIVSITDCTVLRADHF